MSIKTIFVIGANGVGKENKNNDKNTIICGFAKPEELKALEVLS